MGAPSFAFFLAKGGIARSHFRDVILSGAEGPAFAFRDLHPRTMNGCPILRLLSGEGWDSTNVNSHALYQGLALAMPKSAQKMRAGFSPCRLTRPPTFFSATSLTDPASRQ